MEHRKRSTGRSSSSKIDNINGHGLPLTSDDIVAGIDHENGDDGNFKITYSSSNGISSKIKSKRSSWRRRSQQQQYQSSNKRRVSAALLRTVTGLFFGMILIVYILITRHILLHPTNNKKYTIRIPKKRILFQPVVVHPADDKINDNHQSSILSSIVPNHMLPTRPRTVGVFFAGIEPSSYLGTDLLPLPLPDNQLIRIHRQTMLDKEDMKKQKALLNSKDYKDNKAETFKDMGKHCVAQYDWQESFYPTCNHLMEVDMTNLQSFLGHPHVSDDDEESESHDDDANKDLTIEKKVMPPSHHIKFLANGYWRDVWGVDEKGPDVDPQRYVLKTIRYEHEFAARNYDRHRRDAVAMERLTASPFIMDIYASCSNSGLFEFADGGDLSDSVFYDEEDTNIKPWTPKERLVVAYQVAAGVAAVHNVAKEGVPAIAHTDISSGQFVYVQQAGLYKLNDFNRCRFIGWNNKTNEQCTFQVGNNPGTMRSPEEYAYEPETEKIDVYSLGNVMYIIVAREYPFEGEKSEKVAKKVKEGKRPKIPESISKSEDPFDQAMVKAIEMCWIQDPKERATSRQVQTFINNELKRLGVKEDLEDEAE